MPALLPFFSAMLVACTLGLALPCRVALAQTHSGLDLTQVKEAQAQLDHLEAVLPDDLADASAELSEDVDRWVLHDVLQDHGLAASQDWRPAVEALELMPQQADTGSWQQDLVRARLGGLLRGWPEQHHRIDPTKLAFDIPLATHPLVDMYIEYFTGRGRLMFERWLIRAAHYAPLMQNILARQHVPQDLVYVAMIESGFSAHAYSSAAASGYWQFMPTTGQLYGLQQDYWVDERRDFVKATEAAATYMQQLHRTLGNWHLAWASYNAGEGRIRRALSKYGEHDFWGLIEHRDSVAKETMHYVPKVIAAALVAKDAKRYGFNIPVQPLLVFDEVCVTGAIDLHVLADRAHLSRNLLKDLNPSLLHGITPPGQSTRLRVPRGEKKGVLATLHRLPGNQRLAYLTHQVRPAETLSGIAHRFGTDLTVLQAFNRLHGSRLRAGQVLIVPTVGRRPVATLASNRSLPGLRPRPVMVGHARTNRPRHLRRNARQHVVSAGDTLWGIAQRYHVGIERVRGHRRSNHLAIGDVLEIL